MKRTIIVSSVYLVFGLLWIYLSDWVLYNSIDDNDAQHTIQNYKGFLFVFLSTILIFSVTYLVNKKLDKQKRDQKKLLDEYNLILENTIEYIGLVERRSDGQFYNLWANNALYKAFENVNFPLSKFHNTELKEHYAHLVGKDNKVSAIVESKYQKVFDERTSVSFEMSLKLVNEEVRILHYRLSPVMTDGEVTHLLFIINEVTENQRARIENQLAKIRMLSSQLNPHFIFNTLTSIQYYVLNEDVKPTVDYISSFSSLMRSTLDNSQHNLISLQKELDFIHTYIELEQKRRDKRVKVNCVLELDDWLETELFIPPMLLQPYIENAFAHAFLDSDDNHELSITFEVVDETSMRCTIDDNGIGIENKEAKKKNPLHRSHAMNLISERIDLLNLIYNYDFRVFVIDKSSQNERAAGTRIQIEMPLFTSDEMIPLPK